jgi:hypothetical protein
MSVNVFDMLEECDSKRELLKKQRSLEKGFCKRAAPVVGLPLRRRYRGLAHANAEGVLARRKLETREQVLENKFASLERFELLYVLERLYKAAMSDGILTLVLVGEKKETSSVGTSKISELLSSKSRLI